MSGEATVEEQPCGCTEDLNSMKGFNSRKDPNSMKNINSIKEGLVWGDAFSFFPINFGGYPKQSPPVTSRQDLSGLGANV